MQRNRCFGFLAACLTSACTAAGAVADPTAMTKTADPAPGPGALIRETRADAAQRAGVEVDSTTVVSSEAVTWRDGSLGCPSPGAMYTQALVPGWRIVVEAGGTTWSYHASRQGRWILCPRDRAQQPSDSAK